MEVARALNLVGDEEEPILAMEEAMAHGDTPQTLVTLWGTLVIAKFQVFPILCDGGQRSFMSLRLALTADVDATAIGDDADRAELVLQRLEEELKPNDKTMADYGLLTCIKRRPCVGSAGRRNCKLECNRKLAEL